MVPGLRQELDLVLKISDYESFFRELYQTGIHIEIVFADLYKGSFIALSENEVVEKLFHTKYCGAIFENKYRFNIEVLKLSRNNLAILTLSRFRTPCLKNKFLGEKNFIHLLKLNIFIPLALKLAKKFLILEFDIVSRHDVLHNIMVEEPKRFIDNSGSIIARIYEPHPLQKFKRKLFNNIGKKYEIFFDPKYEISFGQDDFIPEYPDTYLVGVCSWFYMKIEGFYVKFTLNGALIFFKPLEPYKMKDFNNESIIDLEFYLLAFTNIVQGFAVSEVIFDPLGYR